MNDLVIDYEKTMTLGTQVIDKGTEFSTLLTKIKNINTELATYWQGQDASKYSDKVATQAEYMQQLANTIDEIGAFLQQVSTAYKKAMDSNTLN